MTYEAYIYNVNKMQCIYVKYGGTQLPRCFKRLCFTRRHISSFSSSPPTPSLEDIPADVRYGTRIQLNVASLNTIMEKQRKYGTNIQEVKVKVKQSRFRPGVVQRVPGI
jgi:hypothetical protein